MVWLLWTLRLFTQTDRAPFHFSNRHGTVAGSHYVKLSIFLDYKKPSHISVSHRVI